MSKSENTIFVGMDVHKKAINVAVTKGSRHGIEDQWQLTNDKRSVRRLVRRLKKMGAGEIKAAYEAGPCGYALQRELAREGIDCDLVAPSLIPQKPGDRVKTDRRDARKLAEMLEAGMLTTVHPPTEKDEAVRDLTRAREDAKQDQMRTRHRLSKLLLRRGIVFHGGSNWTKRHHQWLRGIRFEDEVLQHTFDEYLLAVEQAAERVARLNEKIKAVSESDDYREHVGWLRCLRGIDTITAMTVLAELHDFRRFTHPRKLMSYLGLTPSEYSSSNRTRRGAITKVGNSHVRRVLIEAAWNYRHRPGVSATMRRRREGQPAEVIAIADRAQQRLYSRYRKLKDGYNKPHNVVTVAIARELVGFIWAVLSRGMTA